MAEKKATEKKETKKTKKEPAVKIPDLIQMLETGVHFGHERSKRNPKMEKFIYQQRNRVAIIDLEKTHEALQQAASFARRIAKESSRDILFVGTKRQARAIVQRHAESISMPYVTKRWLGGTLTNFATIQKSIEKLDELKGLQETEATEKMTKKEKAVMRKEIERLEAVLEGMKDMRTLPSAIFVVGAHDEKLAVREANRIGIPVIGLLDTNANPDLVEYGIPANDDAVRAIDLIVGTISQAIADGRGIKPEEVKTPEKVEPFKEPEEEESKDAAEKEPA